jgi:hypothetical protein
MKESPVSHLAEVLATLRNADMARIAANLSYLMRTEAAEKLPPMDVYQIGVVVGSLAYLQEAARELDPDALLKGLRS